MQDLKLAWVQTHLYWENTSLNLEHLESLLTATAPKCDLLLLPEMFTTGFTMNTSGNAASMHGPEVAWMQRMATKLNCVVAGSLHVEVDQKHYNRLLVVDGQGVRAWYDKRHLFAMAGEQEAYTPGSAQLVHRIGDWRINFQICYDLRFPVWARNTGNYDALVYVANWPERRAFAWRHLLIARAIENQSYVLGVNRIGRDGMELNYSGDSLCADPMGEVVADSASKEGVFEISLSASHLIKIREQLPFLRDADHFTIDK
jgi:omega-amidase